MKLPAFLALLAACVQFAAASPTQEVLFTRKHSLIAYKTIADAGIV